MNYKYITAALIDHAELTVIGDELMLIEMRWAREHFLYTLTVTANCFTIKRKVTLV